MASKLNEVCNKGTVVHCYIVFKNSNITTKFDLAHNQHHHQFFLNDFAIYRSMVYKIQEMVYLAFISEETCSNVLFLVSGTNEKMNSTDMAQIMLKDINVQDTPRPSKNRKEIKNFLCVKLLMPSYPSV